MSDNELNEAERLLRSMFEKAAKAPKASALSKPPKPKRKYNKDSRGRKVDPIDATIATRMGAFRIAAGMSVLDAADALGISNQQIYKYETGKNRMAASMLYRVAKLYGVPVDSFFTPIEGSEE